MTILEIPPSLMSEEKALMVAAQNSADDPEWTYTARAVSDLLFEIACFDESGEYMGSL